MPFTAQEVINDAVVLHRTTQEPAQLSDSGMEVLQVLNRSLQGIYRVGARVNPGYHGKVANVNESSGSWPRPADCELLVMIQDGDGAEVIVSTPQEPLPDPTRPTVVRWGHVYRRPPGETEPTGVLAFWFSRRPALVEERDDVVDLEDAFRALLVYDLGCWLARRDERGNELAALLVERDRELSLYLASLEHESAADVRNVGQTGTFDSASLVDLKSLLVGGAS